jgi:hypothetical protein
VTVFSADFIFRQLFFGKSFELAIIFAATTLEFRFVRLKKNEGERSKQETKGRKRRQWSTVHKGEKM